MQYWSEFHAAAQIESLELEMSEIKIRPRSVDLSCYTSLRHLGLVDVLLLSEDFHALFRLPQLRSLRIVISAHHYPSILLFDPQLPDSFFTPSSPLHELDIQYSENSIIVTAASIHRLLRHCTSLEVLRVGKTEIEAKEWHNILRQYKYRLDIYSHH